MGEQLEALNKQLKVAVEDAGGKIETEHYKIDVRAMTIKRLPASLAFKIASNNNFSQEEIDNIFTVNIDKLKQLTTALNDITDIEENIRNLSGNPFITVTKK